VQLDCSIDDRSIFAAAAVHQCSADEPFGMTMVYAAQSLDFSAIVFLKSLLHVQKAALVWFKAAKGCHNGKAKGLPPWKCKIAATVEKKSGC
jgi:hypothetical protein